MKKRNYRNLVPATAAFALLFLAIALTHSCATAPTLGTTRAQESEITGSYTLILFGGNYLDDPLTIAFLDKEGDQYTFEPYAPDFQYRVIKGLPAKEALTVARNYVSASSSFLDIQLGKVFDEKRNAIGFEVRPLYLPTTYGAYDVLLVWYVMRDSKVDIHIHLLPAVEKRLQGGAQGDKDK